MFYCHLMLVLYDISEKKCASLSFICNSLRDRAKSVADSWLSSGAPERAGNRKNKRSNREQKHDFLENAGVVIQFLC